MRDNFPPSSIPLHRGPQRPTRARLASELYVRAYWRIYLLTALWVLGVSLLFPIR